MTYSNSFEQRRLFGFETPNDWNLDEEWHDTHLPHDRGPYFNDPQMADVLAWHRSLCEECQRLDKERESFGPPGLGEKGYNCAEWYEIISEYAEYEGRYAFLGNP